ncbi:DNA-binding protein [Polaribacter filamentus]|uniref:DNA-binding protein n=1 Tax=Polaribacter filamentus TaxID=53483 RepID=A0A2S7KVM8_9FLAO|nr:ORF6N domain-containing protein [Polaribacter filamentus]PQB06670.1 DNA-binding protein [Polaribacter filamentus]
MKKKEEKLLIPDEIITNKIYLIRNQKVMLDSHLAELYQVETKRLKEQVKRNLNRFPEDFMFELTKNEYENLRSQFATSSWGGSRYLPLVFTEQGVAMLSSVLNSDRAIAVNIKIIRIFTKMRALLADNLSLRLEIEEIKKKVTNQSKNIELVFSYLDELINKKENKTERIKIGYKKDKG